MKMNRQKLKKIIFLILLIALVFTAVKWFDTLPQGTQPAAQTQATEASPGGTGLTVDTSDTDPSAAAAEPDTSSDLIIDDFSGIPDEDGQEASSEPDVQNYVEYRFRNSKLLNQHYDKHGKEMGFASAADYEKAACDVANDPSALHKTEKEDGDDIYYIEATNDFVVISTDGYIRTYFWPDSGKKYYDKQ